MVVNEWLGLFVATNCAVDASRRYARARAREKQRRRPNNNERSVVVRLGQDQRNSSPARDPSGPSLAAEP
jgi:hypothetical protein